MTVLAASGWTDALIAALAAIGGSIIGAGAVIWATMYGERTQREHNRRDALAGFYSAAMSFGTVASAWAEMQLEGPLADLRLGVRMAGLTGMFIRRLWSVTDAFWQASARARAVATSDELDAIDGLEAAIGDWTFGEPMPASFGPAARRFRQFIERRGDAVIDSGSEVAAESDDASQ